MLFNAYNDTHTYNPFSYIQTGKIQDAGHGPNGTGRDTNKGSMVPRAEMEPAPVVIMGASNIAISLSRLLDAIIQT